MNKKTAVLIIRVESQLIEEIDAWGGLIPRAIEQDWQFEAMNEMAERGGSL